MQNGQIRRDGNTWLLRYWITVKDESGQVVRKRKAVKLASYSDKYRTAASVRPLAAEHLAPENSKNAHPESTDTVAHFLEFVYLPYIQANKKPTTFKSYRGMFRLAKPHLNGVVMREFHTPEADQLLRDATSDKQRAHTTHAHLKAFLSGAFRYAKRTGAVNENPVRDAEIPKGLPKGETHAYTLDEVTAILAVLGEPARTVALLAALSGLGPAELMGLRWEDFTGEALNVRRNVWNGFVTETKTLARSAAVPVLPIVADALEEHRQREGRSEGYIFQSLKGTPLSLDNLYERRVKPALEKDNIEWHGWYAFRRGIATNLYQLGAPDKTVQSILRHANVATTMAYYIKPVAAESRKAMNKLGTAFKSAVRKRKLA